MAPELKRKLEYSDLDGTPDDGRRYELVEGDLYVTPSPRLSHQRILKRLLFGLVDYFEGRSIGEVFAAPVDVVLTNRDVFVPDLLVLSEDARVTDRAVESAPLLVVEILSPSTRARDRGLKARRYAELGVEHYWIVDGEAKRVECHRLAGRVFRMIVHAEGDATLRHPDWDGLELSLSALWRGRSDAR